MQKPTLKLALVMLILINCLSFSFADSEQTINVYFNNVLLKFEDAPRIENNRVMVPLRTMLTALNASVLWREADNTAIAHTGNHRIALKLNQSSADVDGQTIMLDTPPILINNRVYVPLRFFSNAVGLDVMWQAETRSVYIKLAESTQQNIITEPLTIDQPAAKLLKRYGQPNSILPSMYDFNWYIFHNNYKDYKMFGIKDGVIVAIYNKTNRALGNLKLKCGDTKQTVCKHFQCPIDCITKGNKKYMLNEKNSDLFFNNNHYIRVFYDQHNDNKVSATLVIKSSIEQKVKGFYGNDSAELTKAYEDLLFDLANVERSLNGLPLYEQHKNLQQVARAHSQDMIDRAFFDHVNPDGLKPHQRLIKNNLPLSYGAENIACGQYSALYAHHDFMNSEGHRKNILGSAKHMAAGVKFGGTYHRYYTENFYTPAK